VVLMACLMWVSAGCGCAKLAPAPGTMRPNTGGGGQVGSTTGGGTEVPMPAPAAVEEKPAEPTPAAVETPAATETPAEPAKPE